MKPTILFDLDGTLADIKHRRVYLELDKPDWKSFNAAMDKDTPNKAILELYKTLWGSNFYDILIISGRNEEARELTSQWLIKNNIPYSSILMRNDGDYRADYMVKEEMLGQLLAENREILFVVDDRQQVVDMWRRNGITCLQCAEGDF